MAVKLVCLNRHKKLIAFACKDEHTARKYARALTAKGIRVKGIVKV